MLPTVPSSEGRENFPEAVPVIAEIPLVLPSSEGRGKLGTTGTTVWFTVGYCQKCPFPRKPRRARGWMCGSGDELRQSDQTKGDKLDILQHKVFLLITQADTNLCQEPFHLSDEHS